MISRLKHLALSLALAIGAAALTGCSSTKHVPDGKMLLDKVSIHVDNDSVKGDELWSYLRQTPNHKVIGFAKLQLSVYSLSGLDSTKWYNKWLQNIGQPPVIYDPVLTQRSKAQLQQAMVNKGYINAQVSIDSLARPEEKRMALDYRVHAGAPLRIASLSYSIPDSAIAGIIYSDTANIKIDAGALLDRDNLDNFRTNITKRLHNHGYFAFNKDDITFLADTVRGSTDVALTLCVHNPGTRRDSVAADSVRHQLYRIGKVIFITDFDNAEAIGQNYAQRQDTVSYKGITVLYGHDHYIAPQILEEKCHILPGTLYSAAAVDRTYQSLSQLGMLKYINIELRDAGAAGGTQWLDAYVLLQRNKKQNITFEIEGTNSEGDLGFGLGATYQHRNLGKRSNLLTIKGRMAYESLSGNFEGLVNNRYTEYVGEASITFPKFEFPFLSSEYKRRRITSTEFSTSFNYQERPEYTRVIAGAAWKYKWTHRGLRYYTTRNSFDLVDVNYVRLPKSTKDFLDQIAPANPLLRYSYEDHFIMRMGYSFIRTNKRIPTLSVNAFAIQPYVSTLRGSVETAGNLLYALSEATGQQRKDGAYRIFGIQYAQYAKAELDYTYTLNMSSRQAIAFHVGTGVAVPYLNSEMVPFEKRFYAGGANSVRGWGVRTLGPGCYDSKSSVVDFINQCGDILLNLNVEYRAKIFWVFEGAFFIDAGNVWTIRDYETQPGGVFKLDSFYKQIAASYGVGLRLDFTYFLLRFDLGIKAHNPAMNQEPWPLFHPRWKRDTNFHFAVGYPF